MDRVLGTLAAVFVSHLHADHHTVSAGQDSGAPHEAAVALLSSIANLPIAVALISCKVTVIHRTQLSHSAHKDAGVSVHLLSCPSRGLPSHMPAEETSARGRGFVSWGSLVSTALSWVSVCQLPVTAVLEADGQ